MTKRLLTALPIAVSLMVLACTAYRAPEPAVEPQTVILVSLDGFRWDFRERAESPNLDHLVATGGSIRLRYAGLRL